MNNDGAAPVATESKPEAKAMPEELKKFNWGAFLLTWIWGIGHSVWLALAGLVLIFIPVIGFLGSIAFAVYLGVKGNELAWKTGKYTDVEAYLALEKKWMIAGLVVVALGFVLAFMMGAAIVSMITGGMLNGS
ncbi:hypothetical protein A2Y26_00960 [candidate division CPR2 bacterium GWD2_39_7]|nr:MAG: hypothetical protein A2Y27_02745 [candidate division CPR2 bacterium GWD1_39_7]OGB70333.1 MAG: hypothetical protein A2Y26_00960 [candidate division CPR2 bacterium GWD2_39_7]